MSLHNQINIEIIRRMLAYACNNEDKSYLENFGRKFGLKHPVTYRNV